MDHVERDSEIVQLNSQKISDSVSHYREKAHVKRLLLTSCHILQPEPSRRQFDRKTLAQLRYEFDKSIKVDETSGDIIIDLSPFFKICYSDEYKREMTVLKRITKCKKLHELFEHPIPRLFLNLKWNKAAKVFYLNLLILSVFIVSMIGYMIYYHSIVGDGLRDKSVGLAFWKWICRIVMVYLIARELCQFYLNFQGHLGLLNLMEIVLIYCGVEAFFLRERIDIKSRKIRHVALILLCTYELLHILSKIRLASLSTYIAIFNRALKTFMKVLILYSLVIIAFATSFHILFVRNDKQLDEEEYFHNFQTFPIALLRTIVMMIGEFDADDLKLNSSTGIIFFLFIIVCTIILLNLLTALTISDTQEIINEGKLFERIQRVKILYFYEKCTRNLINREKFWFFRIPKCLKKFERCLGFQIYSRIFNIWPQLSNSATIIIRTGKNNQILVHESNDLETEIPNPNFVFQTFVPKFLKTIGKLSDKIFEYETASEDVVDAINEIIKKESEVDASDVKLQQILDEIRLLKEQFSQMV